MGGKHMTIIKRARQLERLYEATIDLSFETGWLRGCIEKALIAMEGGDNATALSLLRKGIDKDHFEESLKHWQR